MATKVLNIEFEESKYNELVLAANNEGMPVHDLIRELVEDYLAMDASYDDEDAYWEDESLDNEKNTALEDNDI